MHNQHAADQRLALFHDLMTVNVNQRPLDTQVNEWAMLVFVLRLF